MNHNLLNALMRINLNGPKVQEFDPSDYTLKYVQGHDRCDSTISPRKRGKIQYEEDDDDDYDFETNELNKKYKLGKSALF